MDPYVVSARKYRPTHFGEVIGQEHVTETLTKAIESNHLAQALLFTGPRGVGKTTCARILARMINEDGDQSAGNDFAFNIFELDAASNNSVDDVRSLVDQVRFAPQNGKYKVYIIDEVHMLSQSAFNAFLKTLEEPPAHAIFILATTEKHKIIPTILSRCQIYDFKRISVPDIIEQLRHVASLEGITAEETALHTIAEKADGALRDALSIFDRMATSGAGEVTYAQVLANLSILDHDYYFKVIELARQGDAAGLLLLFNDILEKGFDGHIFLNGLAAHIRDLLVAGDPATSGLLEKSEEVRKRYNEQAGLITAAQCFKSIEQLAEADARFKSSSNQRLLVELSLLRLSGLFSDEKKKSGKSTVSDSTEAKPTSHPAPALKSAPQTTAKRPEPRENESSASAKKANSPDHQEVVTSSPAVSDEVKNTSTADQPARQGPEQTAKSEDSHETLQSGQKLRKGKSRIKQRIDKELSQKTVQVAVEETFDQESSPFEIEEVKGAWNAFAGSIEQTQPVLASLLRGMMPEKSEEGHLLVKVETDYNYNQLRRTRKPLIDDIKQRLKLDKLRMDIRLEKNKKDKRPYYPKDIYEHFLELNPELQKLVTELKLKY